MLQESEFNSFALIIQSVNVSPTRPRVLPGILGFVSPFRKRWPSAKESGAAKGGDEEEIHPRCPD